MLFTPINLWQIVTASSGIKTDAQDNISIKAKTKQYLPKYLSKNNNIYNVKSGFMEI